MKSNVVVVVVAGSDVDSVVDVFSFAFIVVIDAAFSVAVALAKRDC